MAIPIVFSTGEYKSDSRKDTYNFFLSQLRIRIDMAFGMLTSKFQILKKPLQVKIRNAGKVFLVCARLHNFIINERIAEYGDNCDKLFAYNGDDEEGDHTFIASDVSVAQIRGNSIMRDILVDRIASMALVRPQDNRERNKRLRRNTL